MKNKIFAMFVMLLWPCVAAATMDVPQITFTQATNMVIAAKHANPSLLDMRLSQQQAHVQLDLIVVNNLNRVQAKAVGLSVLRLAKSMSLDTPVPPNNKAKNLGQGLYDYKLLITKPNGQPWLQAIKLAAKNLVHWQDISPTVPATRQLIQELQSAPQANTSAVVPLATVTPQTYQAGSAPVFGVP